MTPHTRRALFCAVSALMSSSLAAQAGSVLQHQKVSALEGGLSGVLDGVDRLGISSSRLGDLDGDGLVEVAVGAHLDDDGGMDRGAVWILSMGPSGAVMASSKISDTQGGFTGVLDNVDRFGISLEGLGDIDGDGIPDLAVGAYHDDDGGSNRGAVWLLYLDAGGTVKSHAKISATSGGFTGALQDEDLFGREVVALGDLDGDGVQDLLVTANRQDQGGVNRGAAYVLFLNADGSVRSHTHIGSGVGGFGGSLDDDDRWGTGAARIGDLDGDGLSEVALGARNDDDGGQNSGAVYVLFLNPDGTVRQDLKIGAGSGGFTGSLGSRHQFGFSLGSAGDLDGDGRDELAVGTIGDNDGAVGAGAVWLLHLANDGSVLQHSKISALSGGFTGALGARDRFGSSVCSPGDLDGDGNADLIVGASDDDDGGVNVGSVWTLFLDGNGDPGPPVPEPPLAGLFATPTSGEAPLAVSFTDASGGIVTSWSWDFGDGGVSSLRHPTHTYEMAGTYSVGLTVTGPDGVDTLLQLDAIVAEEPAPPPPPPAPGQVIPYGCGVNVSGSLVLISGTPSIGTTLQIGIDNPIGTQSAGASGTLFVSLDPHAAYPCGSLVAGFGMAGAGQSGELLVDLAPPNPLYRLVAFGWGGPGNPLVLDVVIPDDPVLVGTSAYMQGWMKDSSGSGVRNALSEAFEVVIGL